MKKHFRMARPRAWRFCLAAAACLFFAQALPAESCAAAPQPSATCTSEEQFSTELPLTPSGNEFGMVSAIAGSISDALDNVSRQLFESILQPAGGFIMLVQAALTLYIAIYGILFTFGMTQISVYDFMVRLIKIAIIAILVSPGAWDFFSRYVVNFFNGAVDEIINYSVAIAFADQGCAVNPADCEALGAVDRAISKAVSANMAVHLIATAFTSMYGLIYTILIAVALWALLGAILTAIWVYLMSMVLRALLFGIAPLFIACLLFDRTRHLFQGWLNQVVNACLQPIMLFMFFGFFVVLSTIAIDGIMEVPVCWTEASQAMKGTPFSLHFWRYEIPSAVEPDGYEMYGGSWGFTGADAAGSPVFPLDIVKVLVFLIIAELGRRFNQVVLMIAKTLAASSTDLAGMQSALGDVFSAGGRSVMGGGAGRGTASRALNTGISGTGTGSLPLNSRQASGSPVNQAAPLQRTPTP